MSEETTPIEETPANPFAGIEEAFAADLEARRVDFRLHDRDCYVVLRPMDASAASRYRSGGHALQLDTTKNSVHQAQVVMDQDRIELDLLLGTISDFAIARLKKAKGGGGEQTVEMVMGADMAKPSRAVLYSSFSRQFRDVLVALCMEVNELDPLAL